MRGGDALYEMSSVLGGGSGEHHRSNEELAADGSQTTNDAARDFAVYLKGSVSQLALLLFSVMALPPYDAGPSIVALLR